MRLLVLAPAVASGLLLAFSRTLWSFATIAEVYALNTLLIVTVIFCLLRWRRSGRETASSHDDSWLYAAAFLVGLGLGVHHVTVALTLPALAVFAGRTCGADLFANKNVLWAALLSVTALVAVYAYLPLAASAGASS